MRRIARLTLPCAISKLNTDSIGFQYGVQGVMSSWSTGFLNIVIFESFDILPFSAVSRYSPLFCPLAPQMSVQYALQGIRVLLFKRTTLNSQGLGSYSMK
jgi:hypothetical protein